MISGRSPNLHSNGASCGAAQRQPAQRTEVRTNQAPPPYRPDIKSLQTAPLRTKQAAPAVYRPMPQAVHAPSVYLPMRDSIQRRTYTTLTAIGDQYTPQPWAPAGEVGTPGHRVPALNQKSALWKKAKLHYDKLRTATSWVDPADLAMARGELDNLTQLINRQNATLTSSGDIDWTLSARTVAYDPAGPAQDATRVHPFNGLIYRDNQHTHLLDTHNMVTHFSGPGAAVFVMGARGDIHVASHSVGEYHHSSLLAGASVAGAGEIRVSQGRVTWLSNKSGHYMPSEAHLIQVLHQLQKAGVPLGFKLDVHNSLGSYRQYFSADYYLSLSTTPDYEALKLESYVDVGDLTILRIKNWRLRRTEAELKSGYLVYEIGTNKPVDPRTVRKWLKNSNRGFRTQDVQLGTGR